MSRVTDLIEEYAFWDDAARRARRQLDRQQDRKTSVKITYSDLPRGGDPETMEDYIAERMEMEMDLDEIKERRFRAYSKIMALAFKLTSKKQFDIIYRRDLHRDGWRRICKDLDIKRSAATDLHTRAIRALERIDSESGQSDEFG